jgi:hypothetical protein
LARGDVFALVLALDPSPVLSAIFSAIFAAILSAAPAPVFALVLAFFVGGT